MKIRIEEEVYSGSPSFIMDQLLEQNFGKDDYGTMEEFLEESAETYSRLTDMPCELPGGTLDEKAKVLIYALAEIDALEVLEDE
jgi:hypothetical protein